jgi:uncharacterized protein (DUF1697 family)
MAELRGLVESLGYRDVSTLLNSGNVVFTVPKGKSGDLAPRIEKAIKERLGVSTRVTALTGKEVVAAVRENPLTAVAVDPSRLLVLACPDPKDLKQLSPLLKERWAPEAIAVSSRVAYLWCAGGVVDSKLWKAASRALGEAATARNIATMTKLSELVDGA